MTESIKQHIDHLKYQELLQEKEAYDCASSILGGRTYSLKGCTGALSFKEIALAASKKAHETCDKVDGKKLYQRLMQLHKLGEEQLSKMPWWTRIVIAIKRVFTFRRTSSLLNSLKKMNGYNSVTEYFQSRTDEIVQELNRLSNLSLTKKDVHCTSVTMTTLRSKTHGVQLTVTTPQKTVYKPSQINLESAATLPDCFQRFMKEIQISWPAWLQVEKELDLIASELKKEAEQEIREKNSSLVLKSLNVEIGTWDKEAGAFPMSCTLRFLTSSSLTTMNSSLQPIHFIPGSSPDALIDQWKQEIHETLSRPIFDQPYDDIFTSFFGYNPFNIPRAREKKASTIEENLTTLEKLLKKPNSLLPLLRSKKFKELEKALKDAYREVSLKYHPDKLKQRGASEEEMQAAEEVFKQFVPAYNDALEQVQKRTGLVG